jgi:hypothetical protein
MRPASSRFTLQITVLCLLAALAFSNLASAQDSGSKKKPLHQTLSAHPVASAAAERKTAQKAAPPLTSDTWNGTAGDGQ